MSTVIKCKVDGISKELELQGGLSFNYTSTANVNNPSNNKKITFGPVQVSAFSFSIMEPDEDSVKALIKWLVSHEVKNKVTFIIRDRDFQASTRDIVLEQACLTSYSEAVSADGSEISLEIVGQKVTIDTVAVDQTSQR